jgi:hypothetical protein
MILPLEMIAYFAAVKIPKLSLTLEIICRAGLREQEAIYRKRSSIDFRQDKSCIRKIPRFGFKLKDKDQRDISIETELLDHSRPILAALLGQRFMTATNLDKPHSELLRKLKRVVNRAHVRSGDREGCRRGNDPKCAHWCLDKLAYRPDKDAAGWRDLRTVTKCSVYSDSSSAAPSFSSGR